MSKPTGAPGEVPVWLETYTPADVPARLWQGGLRAFVMAAMEALDPPGLAMAGRYARLLTRLAAWCLSEGMPLEFEVVLDPDTVERFCAVGLSGDASRGTYRADLRRIGPRLTSRAPWEPRPESLTRRQVAPPYLSEELRALRRDADRQSTPGKCHAARALLALGAGAGLDGRWCSRVGGSDVSRGGGVVLVRVGDPSARLVPVSAAFESEVLDLAATSGDQFLVGGRSLARNRAGFLASQFETALAGPRLSASRLRSTWLVHCLTVGVRLPELTKAAGLCGITVLSDLLEYVPPLERAEMWSMLRGQSTP